MCPSEGPEPGPMHQCASTQPRTSWNPKTRCWDLAPSTGGLKPTPRPLETCSQRLQDPVQPLSGPALAPGPALPISGKAPDQGQPRTQPHHQEADTSCRIPKCCSQRHQDMTPLTRRQAPAPEPPQPYSLSCRTKPTHQKVGTTPGPLTHQCCPPAGQHQL